METRGTIYRGNASRSGVYPEIGPVGELNVLWQWAGEGWLEPGWSILQVTVVIADRTILASAEKTITYEEYDENGELASQESDSEIALIAFDLDSRRIKWIVKDCGGGNTPAVANGTVFVSGWAGMVVLDLATGERRGLIPRVSDSYWSRPVVSQGILYFGCDEGKVFAIDALTGTLKMGLRDGPQDILLACNRRQYCFCREPRPLHICARSRHRLGMLEGETWLERNYSFRQRWSRIRCGWQSLIESDMSGFGV
jgi:hypothetical protein